MCPFHHTRASRRLELHNKILSNHLPLRDLGRHCDPRKHSHRPPRTDDYITFAPSWASILTAVATDPVKTLFEGDAWARTLRVTVPPHKRQSPLYSVCRSVDTAVR